MDDAILHGKPFGIPLVLTVRSIARASQWCSLDQQAKKYIAMLVSSTDDKNGWATQAPMTKTAGQPKHQ
jgi:hypothetical protein